LAFFRTYTDERRRLIYRRMWLTITDVILGRRRVTDIEQPLTGRNLIKSANLFPKQAKDLDLHVVEALDEGVNFVLPRDADAVNPF
jgi:hypothetical protein